VLPQAACFSLDDNWLRPAEGFPIIDAHFIQ